jgi:hypothetical protein
MTAIDVNDFLASSGSSAPALKFDTLGDTYEGVILDSEVRDVTDFKTGDVQTYADGRPKKQLHITLDIEGEERSLWAKGQMLAALREALAGSKLVNGGTLKIQYASDKPNEKPGLNAQKIYKVRYTQPAAGTELPELPGDEPF